MSRNSNKELCQAEVIFCAETSKAIGFWKTDAAYKDKHEPTWFPKSQVSVIDDRGLPKRGEAAIVEAPAWLLEKEGMA
jgi:hypothetical protein